MMIVCWAAFVLRLNFIRQTNCCNLAAAPRAKDRKSQSQLGKDCRHWRGNSMQRNRIIPRQRRSKRRNRERKKKTEEKREIKQSQAENEIDHDWNRAEQLRVCSFERASVLWNINILTGTQILLKMRFIKHSEAVAIKTRRKGQSHCQPIRVDWSVALGCKISKANRTKKRIYQHSSGQNNNT